MHSYDDHSGDDVVYGMAQGHHRQEVQAVDPTAQMLKDAVYDGVKEAVTGLMTVKGENIYLNQGEQDYDANGFRFNAIVCPDNVAQAGTKITVNVDGAVSYTYTLAAGINQTDFVDGSRLSISGQATPVTLYLLRSNFPFKTA